MSLAQAIWGPLRYTYEDVDHFSTLIELPEDSYAVVITLQRVYYGRTKTPKHKHIQTWCLDVDAPRGVPTHYDSSGGYKGDRTFGWGVDFNYPRSQGWQIDAKAAVTSWVLKERSRTGFREPQKQE